jgi:hypothetical protein
MTAAGNIFEHVHRIGFSKKNSVRDPDGAVMTSKDAFSR